jgi:hypothetical protein
MLSQEALHRLIREYQSDFEFTRPARISKQFMLHVVRARGRLVHNFVLLEPNGNQTEVLYRLALLVGILTAANRKVEASLIAAALFGSRFFTQPQWMAGCAFLRDYFPDLQLAHSTTWLDWSSISTMPEFAGIVFPEVLNVYCE